MKIARRNAGYVKLVRGLTKNRKEKRITATRWPGTMLNKGSRKLRR